MYNGRRKDSMFCWCVMHIAFCVCFFFLFFFLIIHLSSSALGRIPFPQFILFFSCVRFVYKAVGSYSFYFILENTDSALWKVFIFDMVDFTKKL